MFVQMYHNVHYVPSAKLVASARSLALWPGTHIIWYTLHYIKRVSWTIISSCHYAQIKANWHTLASSRPLRIHVYEGSRAGVCHMPSTCTNSAHLKA